MSLRTPSAPSRPTCTASKEASGRTVERAARSSASRLVSRSGPTIVSPTAVAIQAPRAGVAQGPHRLRNSRCGVRMTPVRPRERSTTVAMVSAGVTIARNLASSARITEPVCRPTGRRGRTPTTRRAVDVPWVDPCAVPVEEPATATFEGGRASQSPVSRRDLRTQAVVATPEREVLWWFRSGGGFGMSGSSGSGSC